METSSRGNFYSQIQKRKQATRTGVFAALLAALLWSGGCGAPGEPVPPSPPIPVVVGDLAAHQLGEGVMLEFALPVKSTTGERLKEIPTMEVLRGFPNADGTIDERAFRVVDTIPGALLENYMEKGKVRYLDPIAPEELSKHVQAMVIYRVRARVSDKKTSVPSNEATVKLVMVAEVIDKLGAQVTENGIELSWGVPKRASGAETIGEIAEYHVYRGEAEASAAGRAAQEIPRAAWKSPLLQIAATKAPEYRDAAFTYGKTYVYVVRTVLSGEGQGVESGDSRAAIVTPVDTFPPAAPQGVVAAVSGEASGGKFVVDLSWSINLEADLAGYRVYRSEQQGTLGEALNAELVATPAYRDGSAVSGKKYWYSVKAADRAGNESKASEQVAAP